MTVLRTQVILNPSASTRDQVMNTLWCAPAGETDEDIAAAAFKAALDTFYQAVDSQFSSELNGSVPLLRVFNLADPKPRQPIYEANLSALVVSGTSKGPREIACCVSFKGTYISGQNPARRRGRIYLGPLRGDVIDTNTGLFTSSVVSQFQSAADALLTTSKGSGAFRWVVYSPTTDTDGNGAIGVYDIVDGWVDNNPDVQRRRQSDTRAKSAFS